MKKVKNYILEKIEGFRRFSPLLKELVELVGYDVRKVLNRNH